VLPAVMLPGMNCTQLLWQDSGLENAIHPALERATITDQVDELLRTLPESFVLVGHSLGGIVGMALALAAPHRVAGLCLTATNAKAPAEAQQNGWRHWLRLLNEGADSRGLQAGIVDALIGTGCDGDRDHLVERALAMGEETGAGRLRAQLEMQLTRTDLLGRLHTLEIDTLVVSGLRDGICPPANHVEIASQIAGSRLLSVDAGHLLPLERPNEFADIVREWRAGLLSESATPGDAGAASATT
jgi:pimeloyl-ACP methyl ester carboxylesterase